MKTTSRGNIFFHSISDNVKDALIRRQKVTSNPNPGVGKGSSDFDHYTKTLTWRYRKNAWANLYWHCPRKTHKDELLCGSDFVNYNTLDEFAKEKRSNYPINERDKSSIYEPVSSKDNRYVPIMMLQNINITNEGRLRSLQKATFEIKVHSMKQLEELESKIMFPGADIRLEYGWTGGLGPVTIYDNPDKDNFVGIVYNFSWQLNEDLTIIVTIQAVGKGFVLTALPATGINRTGLQDIADENDNKIYANTFVTKLKQDIKFLSNNISKKNNKSNGWYQSNYGGYSMTYGVKTFNADASVPTGVEAKDYKTNAPSKQTFFYVKLSDIFNYYNKVVLSKIPRISDGNKIYNTKFSANYGIDKTGRNGEQEDENLAGFFLPCSISMYDPDIVSSDPTKILFNGCASYEYERRVGSEYDFSIPPEEPDWAHASFYRHWGDEGNGSNNCEFSGGVNLGEILVNVDFLIEIINSIISVQREPVAKSVQALGEHIFSAINECSGYLYQLSWMEVEIKKADKTSSGEDGVYTENWICVTDPQYTICNPAKWTFGIERPDTSLVRKISLASKVPNSLLTSLYVGGRGVSNNIAAIDSMFPSSNSVTSAWWLTANTDGRYTNRQKTRECQVYENTDVGYADPITNKTEYNKYVNSMSPATNVSSKRAKAVAPYESIIQEAAVKYSIDPNLIKAVIYQESRGNATATSGAGAKGLMQLVDGTAKDMGVVNSFDPYDNIMGGTRYLRMLMDMFENNVDDVLAGYNAGPNKLKKKGREEVYNYKETKTYMKNVKQYREEFAAESRGEGANPNDTLVSSSNPNTIIKNQKTYPETYKVSKYFTLREFYCKGRGTGAIAPPSSMVPNIELLARQLDVICDTIGGKSKIQITSGYRTPQYNKFENNGSLRQGAKANSNHMLGMAADISVRPNSGMTNIELLRVVKTLMTSGKIHSGWTYISEKKNFIHYDVGTTTNRSNVQNKLLTKYYGGNFANDYSNLKFNKELNPIEVQESNDVTSLNPQVLYKHWYKDGEIPDNPVTEQSIVSQNDSKGDDPYEILKTMRDRIGKSGATRDNIINLKSALIEYISKQKAGMFSGDSEKYAFVRRDLYPLECTIVLDGIAGFRFGDAVMIDYVPKRYKENLCFVVTKVLHSINKGGWETTLLLQAKVITNVTQVTNEPRKDGIGQGKAVQTELNPMILGREYEENVDRDVSTNTSQDNINNPVTDTENETQKKHPERNPNQENKEMDTEVINTNSKAYRPTKVHPADK